MPPLEAAVWDAWLKGNVQLPEINWDKDCGETPAGSNALQKANKRAKALNRLYGTDRAEPGHAVWFTAHHLVLPWLVKAMTRVIAAESRSSQTKDAEVLDLAELQTIKAIIASSMKAQQNLSATSTAYGRSINKKINLLINHQRMIQHRRQARAIASQTSEETDNASFATSTLGQ